jgi:hypothetical protein
MPNALLEIATAAEIDEALAYMRRVRHVNRDVLQGLRDTGEPVLRIRLLGLRSAYYGEESGAAFCRRHGLDPEATHKALRDTWRAWRAWQAARFDR